MSTLGVIVSVYFIIGLVVVAFNLRSVDQETLEFFVSPQFELTPVNIVKYIMTLGIFVAFNRVYILLWLPFVIKAVVSASR